MKWFIFLRCHNGLNRKIGTGMGKAFNRNFCSTYSWCQPCIACVHVHWVQIIRQHLILPWNWHKFIFFHIRKTLANSVQKKGGLKIINMVLLESIEWTIFSSNEFEFKLKWLAISLWFYMKCIPQSSFFCQFKVFLLID